MKCWLALIAKWLPDKITAGIDDDLFYQWTRYDGKTFYQEKYLKAERTIAWEESQNNLNN